MSSFQLADPQHESVRLELLSRYGTSHYHCAQFTRVMAERFPDLQRVAGFYFAPDSEASHGEHWWLEAKDGAIVDPTADQFPSQGRGRYVRYDPKQHTVVKGSCMCCGMPLVSRMGHYPCSESCDRELAQEYGCRMSGGPYECDMDIGCDADIVEKYGLPLKLPF